MKFYTRHKSSRREYYRTCKSENPKILKINFRIQESRNDLYLGYEESGDLDIYFKNPETWTNETSEHSYACVNMSSLSAAYTVHLLQNFPHDLHDTVLN